MGRGKVIAGFVALLFVIPSLTYLALSNRDDDDPVPDPTEDPMAQVEAHLSEATDDLLASYEALDKDQYDLAEMKAAAARQDVVAAYAAYREVRERLPPEDRQVLLDGLVFYRDLAQAAYDMSLVQRVAGELTVAVDEALAAGDDILYYLPEYEILGDSYLRNADQWEDLAKETERIFRDHPESSLYFGIDAALARDLQQTADGFRDAGQILLNVSQEYQGDEDYEPFDDRVLPHDDPYDDTVDPVETTPIPTGDEPPPREADDRLLASYITPQVAALFNQFDADDSDTVDFGEAQEFYYWVEQNIQYRYDDENARDPEPGYPIGDGRPGRDYHQTPDETIAEGLGDCEDMNLLEVAFYEYYGITSYQAYVNAKSTQGYDHAIAIVYVGADETQAEAIVGRVDFYTFEEGNDFRIPAGAYIIVDNAYSDNYGYISGGIEAGQFTIFEIKTLGEEWQQEIF